MTAEWLDSEKFKGAWGWLSSRGERSSRWGRVGLFQPETFDVGSQPDGFHGTDEVPADIHLPPMPCDSRRPGGGVMIAVPVFAPGRQLERPQPPDVLAGIAFR